jgi:SAM-dependent methyltransferase
VGEGYDREFFDDVDRTSAPAAAIVAPLLVEAFAPASVIDVGCGRGAWLAAFARLGTSVSGCDGDYVDRGGLLIDGDRFRAVDLTDPPPLGRFDLALCLEVAEHLPAASADALVACLAAASPVVVFSAACPGQGGKDHLNEQWPSYWQAKFAEHGMARFDWLRERIWRDDRIAWWYRQNVAVYATAEATARHEVLRRADAVPPQPGLEVMRVALVDRVTQPTVTTAVRALGAALRRSLRSRTGR